MTDLTLAVPFTDDEQTLELTAGESIALRDFIASRIAAAAETLDQGVAYSGIRDGDAEALEAVIAKTTVMRFYTNVLGDNLGFQPGLPDRLLLDERGLGVLETAASYGQHHLERWGGEEPLDDHDWTTLVELGARVGAGA